MTKYSRTPYLIVHRERQARKDVYGAVDDAIVLHAQLLRGETASGTVIIAMHPIGSPAYLPVFSQLAREGHHVIGCASRYSTGDASLQMENVLLDLGACIRDARERLGYKKIVLAGWSGGGSLMAGYQAQAERRTIVATAAGEETPLATAPLIRADALVLVASHRSRHHLLTGQLDASIMDERDPENRDPALDLYDPQHGAVPPYSGAFLSRYRAAQLARNRKISEWAQDKLAELRRAGRDHEEHCFVVHGTMADPRWLDPTIEPNDRKANMTYMGPPHIVNNSPAGLGRYSSLRSWLSQYSFDHAQVDTVVAGPDITIPSLVITASADDACPPSHTDAILEALGAQDKSEISIAGANHYFSGADGTSQLGKCTSAITQWLAQRGFTDSISAAARS